MALGGGRTINVGQLVARLVFRGDTAALDAAQGRIAGLRAGLQQLSPAVTALGTAITGFSALSVRGFLDFEREQTRLRTQVGLTQEQLDELNRTLIFPFSREFAANATDVTRAYFTIASSGREGAEAAGFLRTALQLQVGDYADVTEAVETLNSTLAVYRESGLTAEEAGNLLASAVSAGNFEASRIVAPLRQVAGVAADAGVEFDELLTAFASASQAQPNLNRVATQILALFTTFNRPGAEARKILDDLGISVDELQSRVADDFIGTLVALRNEYGLSRDRLTTLFGSTEAYQGVVSITNDQLAVSQQRFREVAASGDTLTNAVEVVSETLGFRLQRAMTSVRNSMVLFGGSLAPVVSAFLEELQPALESFAGAMSRGDPLVRNLTIGVAALGLGLLGLRAVLFVLTPLMWVWRAVTVAVRVATWLLVGAYRVLRLTLLAFRGAMIASRAAMLLLTAATWAQTAAVAALQVASLGWVGLAILGVVALIAVIATLIIYWDEVTAAIRNATDAVGGFFGAIGDVIGDVLTSSASAVNDALAAADYATNIDLAYSGAGRGGGSSSTRVSNTRVDEVNITVEGSGRDAEDVATEVADRFQRELGDVYVGLGAGE